MDIGTQMRLTGLATGLDTDEVIKNLGKVHQLRIDNVNRERQLAVWRQEAYRNTITMVSDLMKKNFNSSNPASNFRSSAAFAKFSYSLSMSKMGLSNDSKTQAASVLSVTANGNLKNYNQTVQAVAQLASKDTWSGDAMGMQGLNTKGFNAANYINKVTLDPDSPNGDIIVDRFNMTPVNAVIGLSIDGVSRTIILDVNKISSLFEEDSPIKYTADQSSTLKAVYTDSAGNEVDLFDTYMFVPDSKDSNTGSLVTVREYLKSKDLDFEGKSAKDILAGGVDSKDYQNVIKHLSGPNGVGVAQIYVREPGEKDQERTEAFAKMLNDEITKQFGKDYSNVVQAVKDEKSGNWELRFDRKASTVIITDALSDGEQMKKLGVTAGMSNSGMQSRTLGELFGTSFFDSIPTKKVKVDGIEMQVASITINGVDININAKDTLSAFMNRVNSSQANVTLTYNSAADKFELKSKNDGTAANIQEITDTTAQFFEMLKLGTAVEVEREHVYYEGKILKKDYVLGYKFVAGGEELKLEDNEKLVMTDSNGQKIVLDNGNFILRQGDNRVDYNTEMALKGMDSDDLITLFGASGLEDLFVKLGLDDENKIADLFSTQEQLDLLSREELLDKLIEVDKSGLLFQILLYDPDSVISKLVDNAPADEVSDMLLEISPEAVLNKLIDNDPEAVLNELAAIDPTAPLWDEIKALMSAGAAATDAEVIEKIKELAKNVLLTGNDMKDMAVSLMSAGTVTMTADDLKETTRKLTNLDTLMLYISPLADKHITSDTDIRDLANAGNFNDNRVRATAASSPKMFDVDNGINEIENLFIGKIKDMMDLGEYDKIYDLAPNKIDNAALQVTNSMSDDEKEAMIGSLVSNSFNQAVEKIMSADPAGSRTEGKNLIAVINGDEFMRQSNTFTYEGMTYTFHNTFNVTFDTDGFRDIDGKINITDASDEIKIEVNKNTDEIISSIREFVDEYNKIIDHLNNLLNQKNDRDYRPLTDDEKKAMSEDEIKAWEERAKLGIMANDTDLRRLLDQMRAAIYEKVDGVGLSMSEIGIGTSANWKDGGRLEINEEKLRAALENRYDDVVNLFTKQSEIGYSDSNRGQRYKENGIAQRLNDIFNDAARTTRDGFNRKGYLLEKAGAVGDASVVNNQLSKQIDDYDKRIAVLLDRWRRQENTYYQMFARMETAMSKLNAQQSKLAGLMGGGS
ncbi:MAG: flagellar filament capping protein FliD [Chitinispirillales bacterium]|jgi:flagellar capping protein FliD|nr:flagellar filament capping protein FliD [Chitinispirillales bacterium]